MTPDTTTLTAAQAHALLDILTHRETYSAEIELFKTPGIINSYGPPFQDDPSISKSPILQTLFSTFLVGIPGLRDVDKEFWTKRALPIIDDLAKANLSESYDKGGMGVRKMLATLISALIEYPARGVLGGMPGRDIKYDPEQPYDLKNPDDLGHAWKTFQRQVVYGGLLDELFDKAAESDELNDHSQMVIAAHQHIVVNLGSLVHYALITSPKGQMLLSLVERTHKLIPYRLVRQTLKVGNAATMISGMTRLILTKMSLGAVTNWIGWSSGADEGMNLLQTIIYTVLTWDMKELESRVAKLEKAKDAPSKDQLSAVQAYSKLNREEQEKYREVSKTSSTSIIHAILSISPSSPSTTLTTEQHKMLLDYLYIHLSIHDREQLVLALCKSNPDNLTATIREVVAIYEPILRDLHNAVDLSGTIADFEKFLDDAIKTGKISTEAGAKEPTVEDFVALFERHQKSVHRFLHQFCKNGDKTVTAWRDYGKYVATQFQRKEEDTSEGAGRFTPVLNKLVNELADEDRRLVVQQMDEYEEYLQKLNQKTNRRLATIVADDEDRKHLKKGPGNFLYKWQNLLDSTEITPSEATGGKVRTGKDKDVRAASGVELNGEKRAILTNGVNGVVNGTANGTANEVANGTANQGENGAEKELIEMPDVNRTCELLLSRFKEVLAAREY
ncbi:hypothetical protein H072_4178 [Dactylellina haptotyla CBS 200.50]|uniref:PX-associated-domain-containing protein n=1 Tax=Dactylellina haptotyla (strain CBS 200.50) TaxID=1284197 RepID=S8AGA3_DACHA|nr:hypothetical protein H072_4178 [Dactylellina haptotyla CBS 200.50]